MPSTSTDRQVFCLFFMTSARGPLFLHKYQLFLPTQHSASFELVQFFFWKTIFTARTFSFLSKRKWEYTILIRKSWRQKVDNKVFWCNYMKIVWCYPWVLPRTPVFVSLWFWIYVLMLISNLGCIACFVPIPQFMWGGRCIFHCFFIEEWCTFCNHCNKWVCCRQRSTKCFKSPGSKIHNDVFKRIVLGL